MRLHYVEAGDGPLVVLLHGFPEFWYGWRAPDRPARSGRLPRRRARPARLQPVVAAEGHHGLLSRQGGRRHQRPHPRARLRVRDPGRPRLGRDGRLDDRDEPPGGRRAARHPRRGPSAEAPEGALQAAPAPAAAGTSSSSPSRGSPSASCGRRTSGSSAASSATRVPRTRRRRWTATSRRGRSRER